MHLHDASPWVRSGFRRRSFFERIELLEVRFYARIRGVEGACGLERLACFAACLRIARERGREVDPRAGELRIELDRLAIFGDRVGELARELQRVTEVGVERGALRI